MRLKKKIIEQDRIIKAYEVSEVPTPNHISTVAIVLLYIVYCCTVGVNAIDQAATVRPGKHP